MRHSPGPGLTLHSVTDTKCNVSKVEPAAVIERSGERRTIMTYINWTKDVFIDPVTFSASAGPSGIPVPTYGNYGGPDYSDGLVGGTIPLSGALPPLDQLDALFFTPTLRISCSPPLTRFRQPILL
jgi:hypothetical protein